MDDRLVPMEMTLTECAAVNWVLSRVREKTLTGVPSGVVIDQAISEALESAIGAQPSYDDPAESSAPSDNSD